MIGLWLKNRMRKEQIKLVIQNQLASAFIADLLNNSDHPNEDARDDLVSRVKLAGFESSVRETDLLSFNLLPPNHVDSLMATNKWLRDLFD